MLLVEKKHNGQETLENVIDRFFGDATNGNRVYIPAAEIRMTENGATVSLDLPGVERDSIDVTVEKGQILRVKAERKSVEIPEGEKQVLNERASGNLMRTFQIPFRVDADKTRAEFLNGVLELKLFRSEEDKPHRIQIAGE